VIKIFLRIVFLLALPLLIGQSIHYLRDGFNPRRIAPFLNSHVLQEETHFDENIEAILSQPFHYYKRGRQCFAFVSQDQKYILKLPRTDIYKTAFWIRMLPHNKLRERVERQHTRRRNLMLNSMALARDQLSLQTGTLAVHSGSGTPTDKRLTLIDACGATYHFPRETIFFALQERKPLWTPLFLFALKNNDRKQAKKLLSALIDVVIERAQTGIINRDRSFLRNYGFQDGKAYQIDIGSFHLQEEIGYRNSYLKSLCDTFDPMQEWLAKTDPEMEKILLEKKQQAMQQVP